MALSSWKASERIAYDPFTTCGNLSNKTPKEDSEARGAPMLIQTVQRGGHGSLLIVCILLVVVLALLAVCSECISTIDSSSTPY